VLGDGAAIAFRRIHHWNAQGRCAIDRDGVDADPVRSPSS
jgi:hypothetical protein